MSDTMRDMFEAHFKSLDLSTEQDSWGVPQYKHSHVDALWTGWQAAQSQPAPPVPPLNNPDELEPVEFLAGRLIDAWCAAHGKQIPWDKAVEITAIVTKMPDAERARLLNLD